MTERVSFTAIANASSSARKTDVLFTVKPLDIDERTGVDICVVVDVSGSMQMEAVVKTERAGAEQPTLSILDIVRHAVKTVVRTLGPQDRLGIVAYSDRATVALSMHNMDSDGQTLADAAVDGLNADGQTNLWDGLHTALKMLEGAGGNNTASVLLLTDGVPNIAPPGGDHMGALQQYRQGLGGKLPATLYTFGFGNELDSALLNDLATEGGGMFVFIPDAGFVGTALVNCTSNALSSIGRNAILLLEAPEGNLIEGVSGYMSTGHPTASVNVPLGSLQYGQTKDVVVCVAGNAQPSLNATLTYDEGGQTFSKTAVSSASDAVAQDLALHKLRLKVVKTIREAIVAAGPNGAGLAEAQRLVRALTSDADFAAASGETADAIRQDVEGQVAEAVSRQDWYTNWGRHYLRSLSCAHLAQQCNNFKDPGVQAYGGKLFEQVRDAADDIFLQLPPPSGADRSGEETLVAMGFDADLARRALEAAGNNLEVAMNYCVDGIPSRPVPRAHAPSGGGYSRPAQQVDMSMYYDRYGG